MTEARKLYAGAKLREICTRLGLRQADFAARLGVSVSYLNQMENNHRPVPARLVIALAEQFGLNVTELTTGTVERVVADLREALADPVFGDPPPQPIGVSCRICERRTCPQRAVPPLERPLTVDPNIRSLLPYAIG